MPRTQWTPVTETDHAANVNGHELLCSVHPDGRATLYFNGADRGTRVRLRDAQAMAVHLATHTRRPDGTAPALLGRRVSLSPAIARAIGPRRVPAPALETSLLSGRTFGVEVEIDRVLGAEDVSAWNRPGHEALAAWVTASGVRCVSAGYTHATTNHWKIVSDSTVGWGELVSPVLCDESGLVEIGRVLATFNAQRARVGRRCGLHVHFGVNPDLTDVKRIARGWMVAQAWFALLIAPSRRGRTQYCADNPVYGAAQVAVASSVEEILSLMGGTRYVKLNMTPLRDSTRPDTVEFRLHQGTTDAEKIAQWVRLLDSFLTAVLADREVPDFPRSMNSYDPRPVTTADLSAFLAALDVAPAAVAYWVRRAVAFRTVSSPVAVAA